MAHNSTPRCAVCNMSNGHDQQTHKDAEKRKKRKKRGEQDADT